MANKTILDILQSKSLQYDGSLIQRLAYSRDASFYQYIPQVVVHPKSVNDIVELMHIAKQTSTTLTFRGAGTSLSGQAIGNGILVDMSRGFSNSLILNNGESLRCGVSVSGARANSLLRSYNRKIGPDPASISSATIGGIVANNASGMCCGTMDNSYNTIESMTVVLADGLVLDTSENQSLEILQHQNTRLFQGLLELRDTIQCNPELLKKITQKYRIKNTIGYGLNSFLDYSNPLDILLHLMVGSEGTLGCMTDVTLRTIPLPSYSVTMLLSFRTSQEAFEIVPSLQERGARAIEFMDSSSLSSVQSISALARYLPPELYSSALLVEFHQETLFEYQSMQHDVVDFTSSLTRNSFCFTATNSEDQAALWAMRKGILPSIGKCRPKGSTLINEDIAFPKKYLSQGVEEIRSLLDNNNYHQAAIFGHAKDGNIHFCFGQSFENTNDIYKYEKFLDSLGECVVGKYNGSLKAEHGTGRNMAPFVEYEWGSDAYYAMKHIKQLFDPDAILNPDVLISSDPKIHVHNIKKTPLVHETIDSCIECGFCEKQCPSHGLSLSPRQRIIIERELHSTINISSQNDFNELESDYQYSVIDTCATDGMCALSCPVGINTGKFVKEIRSRDIVSSGDDDDSHTKHLDNHKRHISLLQNLSSLAHNSSAFTHPILVESVSKIINTISKKELPVWFRSMGKPLKNLQHTNNRNIDESLPSVWYFPTCTTRLLGKNAYNNSSVFSEFQLLCNAASVQVRILPSYELYCCGNMYSSTGDGISADKHHTDLSLCFTQIHERYPNDKIVIDGTSCSKYFLEQSSQNFVYDMYTFIADSILDTLPDLKKISDVVYHKNCSILGTQREIAIEKILQAVTTNTIYLDSNKCCGTAGDRGFRFPELAQNATKEMVKEIREEIDKSLHITSNAPCQATLTTYTGKRFVSVLELLVMSLSHANK